MTLRRDKRFLGDGEGLGFNDVEWDDAGDIDDIDDIDDDIEDDGIDDLYVFEDYAMISVVDGWYYGLLYDIMIAPFVPNVEYLDLNFMLMNSPSYVIVSYVRFMRMTPG